VFFYYSFFLFADRMTQRDHAWITRLSQQLINGINENVEHVVRNGDPNGYPGCVNLSFAYVEGESLLMALKVGDFALLRQTRWSNAPVGHRLIFGKRMHIGFIGTLICASRARSVNAVFTMHGMLTSLL
jgi:hypothetical protein